MMKTRPDTSTLPVLLAWSLFLVCVAYVLGYVSPRAGVGFSDEGWLLTEAMLSAKGAAVSPFVAQSAGHHILGFFMRMGIENYLAIRYMNVLLTIATSYAFLSGTLNRRWHSLALPMGLCICLFFTFRSIPSYNNTPVFLVAGGIGTMAWAMRASVLSRQIVLALLAASQFTLAGMFNITFAPAISLAPLAVALLYRKRGGWLTLLFFGALYAASLGIHILHIGFDEFFKAPASHAINMKYIERWRDILIDWPRLLWLPPSWQDSL